MCECFVLWTTALCVRDPVWWKVRTWEQGRLVLRQANFESEVLSLGAGRHPVKENLQELLGGYTAQN